MYDTLSSFAATWGLLLFIGAFVLVLVYALWPSSQDRFRRAAEQPLRGDDRPLDSEHTS